VPGALPELGVEFGEEGLEAYTTIRIVNLPPG